MIDWTAVSAGVNTVLAIVTVGVLFLNRQQVQASKTQASAAEDQVKVSREQVQLSRDQFYESQQQVRETLQASQRPFVFPWGPLPVSYEERNREFGLNFEDSVSLLLKNGGTGAAFNIRGVLVQPGTDDEHLYGPLWPHARSLVADAPLLPGASRTEATSNGSLLVDWDTAIDDNPDYTLHAPRRRLHEELSASVETQHPLPVILARLTLTFDDVFGQRHASQFDYISSLDEWHFLRFFPKTSLDLEVVDKRIRRGLGPVLQRSEEDEELFDDHEIWKSHAESQAMMADRGIVGRSTIQSACHVWRWNGSEIMPAEWSTELLARPPSELVKAGYVYEYSVGDDAHPMHIAVYRRGILREDADGETAPPRYVLLIEFPNSFELVQVHTFADVPSALRHLAPLYEAPLAKLPE